MATITSSTGSLIPGIFTFDVDLDTIVTTTATTYAWESDEFPSGDTNKITLVGSFTYPSGTANTPLGTVTQILIDMDNDGTTDLTIAYSVAQTFLADLIIGNNGLFWESALSEVNTFILGGEVKGFTGTFAFDGVSPSVNTTGTGDTATITGSGEFVGDYRTVQDGFTGGDDIITINQTSSSDDIEVIGDSLVVGSGTATGGDDTITDNTVAGTGTSVLIGDFSSLVDGVTVNGGNDTLSATNRAVTIYGDVGSVPVGTAIINGGMDTINGGTSADVLSGDISSGINATTTLNGGDDIINGGGGDDLIGGEFVPGLSNQIVVVGGNDTLIGGSGNDTIHGQTGDDIINGGADDDMIFGGTGNDTIDGDGGIDTANFSQSLFAVTVSLGSGVDGSATGNGTDIIRDIENVIGTTLNDMISGNNANNLIDGGDGNDMLNGGGGSGDIVSYAGASAAVTVSLALAGSQATIGAGDDTLSNFEGIIGSDHDDTLTGNSVANILNGGAGADVINGRDGDDTIDSGDGLDTVNGEGGDDTLIATDTGGIDDFDGGTENDTVNFSAIATGGLIMDLVGGNWDDGITTGNLLNIENIIGTGDNDTISGTTGDNTLEGGDGDDTIFGDTGSDILSGGIGNDRFIYAGDADIGAGESVDGGAGSNSIRLNGFDTYDFSSISITSINELEFRDTSGNRTIQLSGDQFGSGLISLGARFNASSAGSSTDAVEITMSTGTTLDLSAITFLDWGADGDMVTVTGDSSAETISGTAMVDTIIAGLGDDVLNGNGGDDIINGQAGVDNINGGAGDDNLQGGLGNDTLNGDADNDTLFGQADDDVLNGGAGDDLLHGQAGADQMDGGDGDDRLYVDSADTLIQGGSGFDYVHADAGQALNFDVAAANIEWVYGHFGADILDASSATTRVVLHGRGNVDILTTGSGDDTIVGGFANDIITGGAGNDRLYGQTQDDTINGGTGNDSLYGQQDNDILDAGTGRDFLFGGTGDDTLTGGGLDAERDLFVMQTGGGTDTITDYEDGVDKIQFRSIAATTQFSDLAIANNGSGDAVVTYSEGSVTLTGIDQSLLDASDFIF